MHLQVAMKERQEEIFVYREMLSKQHKITEQDMHGLRWDMSKSQWQSYQDTHLCLFGATVQCSTSPVVIHCLIPLCRAQFHERLFKVETMKKRYEIVTISMAAPEDEENEFQAYYIIKVATFYFQILTEMEDE